MKELFLVVYLIATPQGGGNFGGGPMVAYEFSHVTKFEGPTALVECVDMVNQIYMNWPDKIGISAPKFYCVPKGDY